MLHWDELSRGNKKHAHVPPLGENVYISLVKAADGIGWIVTFAGPTTLRTLERTYASTYVAQRAGVELAISALTDELIAAQAANNSDLVSALTEALINLQEERDYGTNE